jgi:ubiquinone/menaquinone biosynthesis C-methylase UbiE
MIDLSEIRNFYDRFGARQDSQGWYEDAAIEALLPHAAFDSAASVIEFGCGTGRFAARLLENHLPPEATYTGLDLSATMTMLARNRTAGFGNRVRIAQTSGETTLAAPDDSCDRFVSLYVLDILSESQIASVIAEAWRVLKPGGRLCLISLTFGATPLSSLVISLWKSVYKIRPLLTGGCHPIRLLPFVSSSEWKVSFHTTVVSRGIPSEILVAEKR